LFGCDFIGAAPKVASGDGVRICGFEDHARFLFSVVIANRVFQAFERANIAIGEVQVLVNRCADGKL
jgi:hypothetical protein